MKWFSTGMSLLIKVSILLERSSGDIGVNLSSMIPLDFALTLNANSPKSLSNVIIILSCWYAVFSTSSSFKPLAEMSMETMSIPFFLRALIVSEGIFSSARNLIARPGGRLFLPSVFQRRILRLLSDPLSSAGDNSLEFSCGSSR